MWVWREKWRYLKTINLKKIKIRSNQRIHLIYGKKRCKKLIEFWKILKIYLSCDNYLIWKDFFLNLINILSGHSLSSLEFRMYYFKFSFIHFCDFKSSCEILNEFFFDFDFVIFSNEMSFNKISHFFIIRMLGVFNKYRYLRHYKSNLKKKWFISNLKVFKIIN